MEYTVKQGEHLSIIAYQHGFNDYHTIWDHPANADLKKQRENPNVLFPGDLLEIPDKTARNEVRQTGATHFFVGVSADLRLRIVLQDVNGDPIPNADVDLIVDGKKKGVLKTTGDGKIDEAIPVTSVSGSVVVRGQEYHLSIGELDPITEKTGWRARLANLGYYFGSGPDIDEEELTSAIEEFQCDNGLTVDGDCGPNTQKKLLKMHGC